MTPRSIRPSLAAVDLEADPPQLVLVYPPHAPGEVTRWLRVRLLRPERTLRGSTINAHQQLGALTPRELELLAESARPGPVWRPSAWRHDAIAASRALFNEAPASWPPAQH